MLPKNRKRDLGEPTGTGQEAVQAQLAPRAQSGTPPHSDRMLIGGAHLSDVVFNETGPNMASPRAVRCVDTVPCPSPLSMPRRLYNLPCPLSFLRQTPQSERHQAIEIFSDCTVDTIASSRTSAHRWCGQDNHLVEEGMMSTVASLSLSKKPRFVDPIGKSQSQEGDAC
jgi:hypothetical protein